MHRQFARLLPLLTLLLVATACHNNSGNTPVTPDPTPDKMESYSDVLTLNGTVVHSFTVTGPSQMTAQLVSLTPNPEKIIGMSLGTWNGSICQIVLDNPATKQGDVVLGATQFVGAADFCLRVYDPNGSIDPAQLYVVIVTHR
jgi:hypothetical protein